MAHPTQTQIITTTNRDEWRAGITALEAGASYPLGDDTFTIDHGKDYFRFFDRLGEVHYRIATVPSGADARVVGAICFVLRRVPFHQGQTPCYTWYGCDAKVHPDYRGAGIGERLLYTYYRPHTIKRSVLTGSFMRGYAISMNPPGQTDRYKTVGERAGYLTWVGYNKAQLHLYSLSYEQMKSCAATLETHRGPIGYLSHSGTKNIVLASTGEPMPLYHVQWGPLADPHSQTMPTKDGVHMFCAPAASPLAREAEEQLGLVPSASATVYTMRMRSDLSFILTSDI